jgi:hypothetical protein
MKILSMQFDPQCKTQRDLAERGGGDFFRKNITSYEVGNVVPFLYVKVQILCFVFPTANVTQPKAERNVA